jgi:8-amino-7-oxononanoate synthase
MEEHKPRNELERTLRDRLDNRFVNSTLRKLTTAPENAVDFSSNDFLSLSTSPVLRSAFLEELTRSGDFTLGSGGSRLLDGNSSYASQLEDEIAAFHNAPGGILFNSGFDANSGLFACVPQPGDVIVHDELIHASVHDGMKMSRAAKKLPFAHNCILHLRKVLESLKEDIMISKGPKNVFIAVESVYSMDGDIAPLAEIVELIDQVLPYGNGHIIVDEAHATGVLGPQGRGLVCKLGLEDRMFARLHTFGKSLAASGGMKFSGWREMNSALTENSYRFVYTISTLISDQLRTSSHIHNFHALPIIGCN